MQARRRLLPAAGALAVLGLLTACEQPTPYVTVYANGTSVHDEAFRYCFDGQDPAAQPGDSKGCRLQPGTPKVVRVGTGDQVLIDVDKELSDSGWFFSLRAGQQGQPQRSAVMTGHVASFYPDFSQSPTLILEVQRVTAPQDDATSVGLWQFALVPE